MPRNEPLSQPVRFGPYELTHRLGAGLIGETYLARDTGAPADAPRQVAIKFIYPAYSANRAFAQYLARRAHDAARLKQYRVLVPLLDMGQASERYFVISEWVQGMDLGGLFEWLKLQGRRLPPTVVAELGATLLKALDIIHSKRTLENSPLLHRHLSPTNVLLGVPGEVRVSDAGLAGAMTAMEPAEQRLDLGYLAPEVARSPNAWAPAADVFSLGVILYEALGGEHPYARASDQRAAAQAAQIPQIAGRSGLPLPLVEVIEAMLHADPVKRVAARAQYLEVLKQSAQQSAGQLRHWSLFDWLRDNSARLPFGPWGATPLASQGTQPQMAVAAAVVARPPAVSQARIVAVQPPAPPQVQPPQVAQQHQSQPSMPVHKTSTPSFAAVVVPPQPPPQPAQPPPQPAQPPPLPPHARTGQAPAPPEPTDDVAALSSEVLQVIDLQRFENQAMADMDLLSGAADLQFTPPVGLEGPMEALAQQYTRTRRKNRLHAVWILGERSSGKSFLLRYAMNIFSQAGSQTHAAYLSPVSPSRPLSVAGLWLESAADTLPIGSRELALTKIDQLSSQLKLDAEQSMCMRTLCGLQDMATPGPSTLFQGTLRLFLRGIKVLAHKSPLVLLVDNAQFLDPVSFRFLHALIGEAQDLPLLLVMACDNLSYEQVFADHAITSITLPPASAVNRERIFATLMGPRLVGPGRVEKLARTPEPLGRMTDIVALLHVAAGPLQWSLDEVIDRMISIRDDDRLRMALPALSEPELQTLLLLATAIEPLNVYALEHHIGQPRPEFLKILGRLLESGLVTYALPKRLALCTWDLGMSLLRISDPARVQKLHRQHAQHFTERLWTGSGNPLAPWVQEQWMLAKAPDAALTHALGFADSLEVAGFPEVALMHAERSLHDLQRTATDTPARRARLQALRARHACLLAQHDLMRACLDEVYQTVQQQELPELFVSALLTDALWMRAAGQLEYAHQYLTRAHQTLAPLEQANPASPVFRALRLALLESWGQWALRQGDLNAATQQLRDALRLAEQIDPLSAARLAAQLAYVLLTRLQTDDALLLLATARDQLNQRPDHILRIQLATADGAWHLTQQEPAAAIERFVAAQQLAFDSGHVLLLFDTTERLVFTAIDLQRFDIAHRQLDLIWQLMPNYPNGPDPERLGRASDWLRILETARPELLGHLHRNLAAAQRHPARFIELCYQLRTSLTRCARHDEAAQFLARERQERATYGWAPV